MQPHILYTKHHRACPSFCRLPFYKRVVLHLKMSSTPTSQPLACWHDLPTMQGVWLQHNKARITHLLHWEFCAITTFIHCFLSIISAPNTLLGQKVFSCLTLIETTYSFASKDIFSWWHLSSDFWLLTSQVGYDVSGKRCDDFLILLCKQYQNQNQKTFLYLFIF